MELHCKDRFKHLCAVLGIMDVLDFPDSLRHQENAKLTIMGNYLLKMGFDLFRNKLLHCYVILALRDNLRKFLLAGSLDPFIDNIASLVNVA